MSEVDNNEKPVEQDELKLLKERANTMGISFHPNIGLDKLKEKVNEYLQKGTESKEEGPADVVPAKETKGARRARKRKEASKLVRVQVTCMNPNKKEWDGELFTVGNSAVGTFRRYVPFDTEDGWHVESIILNMIENRKCQVFYNAKGPRGTKVRKGKLIKEFNVVRLPDLTKEELKELEQKQALANSID